MHGSVELQGLDKFISSHEYLPQYINYCNTMA